jgi:putative peptide maturation dehydrogenase
VAWVRRTRHLALTACRGGPPSVLARSFLTGSQERLSLGRLEELLGIPTDAWVWRTRPGTKALARAGLVVSDEPTEPYVDLRRRDAELTSLGWWPDAAALHLSARWEEVRARVPGTGGRMPAARARRGRPLPPFHVLGGVRTPLPGTVADSPLARLLDARRTVRTFSHNRPVTVGEVATLLYRVWGAHGTARFAQGDVGIRKTSPSGGGLHPIEVYPIARRVSGLRSGVYHYLADEHELERVVAIDEHSVRALLDDATAGQWYLANADIAFAMTARFGRSFWKYRRHAKAYRTIWLDAGHLSQTFYLACTELALGPWVTAALNDDALERVLQLDPLREGVIAVCGCGRLPAARDGLDASAVPAER